MDIFNRVFVIDDRYEEVLPIIQALGTKGISSIYWNGNIDTKPESPLKGIRLVILDMRFSAATDSRSIITHLFTLLRSAIHKDNGPYILYVWSKHDSEYLEEFKKELISESSVPQPYLIINMEKSKFIKVTNEKNEVYDLIASSLDVQGEVEVKSEILEILQNMGLETVEKIESEENIVEKLALHLDEKLKEINSLSILLIWEKIVNISANNLVNDIAQFSRFDGTWDNNIKALIQHLARANAGNSLETTAREYIINALSALNYMLPDELLNQLIELEIDEERFDFISNPAITKKVDGNIFSISKSGNGKKFIIKKSNSDYKNFKNICEVENYEDPDKSTCKELYYSYSSLFGNSNFKLLCERANLNSIKKPGGIYIVDDTDLLNELINSIFKNKENINIDKGLVKLDISSSCDYAQNKLKRVRTLLGVMIKDQYFSEIYNTDDIYCTPELNIEGKIMKIAFNFHYITNESKDNLAESDKLFSFRDLLLTEIKHALSSYISRIGIINL